MQKSDFIARIAEETGVTKKTTRQVIEAAIEIISQSLARGEKVVLAGFGTFQMRERRQRRGVNPQTRQEMIIPASRIPSFSASNRLRDLLQEEQSLEHGNDR